MPRIGSLCSGYGGLEEGVRSVLGGDVVWQSEIDPGARKILAHRYADVPNIGDMTAVDWARVAPVDVLCGGTPCQDLSAAGKRQGMTEGTRSNLWVAMREAIAQLRPSLVVWENVRGAYSARADSELESREGLLGVLGDGPVLRALGRVLGDLSDLGFDAEWVGLPASDVGAPHERFRVFVAAWPADADSVGRLGWPRVGGPSGWGQPADSGSAALSHSTGVRRREGGSEPARLVRRSDDVVGSSPAAEYESGVHCQCGQWTRGRPHDAWCSAAHADGIAVREQPVALPGCGRTAVAGHAGSHAPADADRNRVVGSEGGRQPVRTDERIHPDRRRTDTPTYTDRSGQRPDIDDLRTGEPHTDWGAYGPAVRRWERLTRPAPAPTERGAKGGRRLSPAFVEWMQGLPAGWVTDVPGVTRKEALRVLGNGVVPQQAAAALRLLLGDVRAAA